MNIDAWDIDAVNINAGCIKAWDINAKNINAGCIYAKNINALNIIYCTTCIAYTTFKCKSIRGIKENAIHKCLDQEIEYIE
jgi:hypothetical protein